MTPDEASNELCYDTLSHGGADFIHQHVVGAFGAQEASPNDKPIRLVFSLIGLYLRIENGFTGREVQLAHMKRCRDKPPVPSVSIPEDRGAINYRSSIRATLEVQNTIEIDVANNEMHPSTRSTNFQLAVLIARAG